MEDNDKRHEEEVEEVTNINDNGVKLGKIYVSAPLASKPFERFFNNEDIHGHFEQFGNVITIDHPIDKTSKQKDGFFFVTFEDEKVSTNLINYGSTVIKGFEFLIKPVYVKYTKIFVGAPFVLKPLDKYISSDQIYAHFQQFGKIFELQKVDNFELAEILLDAQ